MLRTVKYKYRCKNNTTMCRGASQYTSVIEKSFLRKWHVNWLAEDEGEIITWKFFRIGLWIEKIAWTNSQIQKKGQPEWPYHRMEEVT